jgi:hypothetical protein
MTVAPAIKVTLEADALTAEDNGPGIPASTIERSLDYGRPHFRQEIFASPTRAGS